MAAALVQDIEVSESFLFDLERSGGARIREVPCIVPVLVLNVSLDAWVATDVSFEDIGGFTGAFFFLDFIGESTEVGVWRASAMMRSMESNESRCSSLLEFSGSLRCIPP